MFVCGILNVEGCDVVVYGYDFMFCVGLMDVMNGVKFVCLIYMVGECGIFLIGMNDLVGVFVLVGVGGFDGYFEVFIVFCKISGLVFSISLMFGYNVGGGFYFLW